jgi:hypothetical protein
MRSLGERGDQLVEASGLAPTDDEEQDEDQQRVREQGQAWRLRPVDTDHIVPSGVEPKSCTVARSVNAVAVPGWSS